MGSRALRMLRTAWCVVVAILVGVLLFGPSSELSSERRLTVLTVLSLLSFPSSFVAAPVGNWLVSTLDVYNTRSIDGILSVSISAAGYAQWFWVVPRVRRMFAEKAPAPDPE